jgi:hypothetical protein
LGELAGAGRLRVFLDIHNPGPSDTHSFLYAPPGYGAGPLAGGAARRAAYDAFLGLLVRHAPDPIPFKGAYRPGAASPEERPRIGANWVHERGGDGVIAVTVEVAWNTPGSTLEGYRRVGAGLGLSVAKHLLGERQ